ncbi:MAG: DNA-binding response regulator [Zetaproteobacteria bacterium CG_4_10_14_3_um_filter_54_28]|nr:MAG: DNA-binding response regulator [Zetaproteobacteria bacterium CG_4_10_14_3_um_filter_54_28]
MMRKPRKTCLLLAENDSTARQMAERLEPFGWLMYVVHSDKQAYDRIAQKNMDVVIADIDAVSLGGLALLIYCHHQNPSTETYAITPANDGYRKKLARDMGGCNGFFYFVDGSLDVATFRGMAVDLANESPSLPCPAT